MSAKKQERLSVFQFEKSRVLSKGSSILPALAVVYLYFFILPQFLHKIYVLLPYDNMTIMYALISALLIAFCSITANLFFYILYTKKIPYFEKFRVSQTPWPWESDPKGYKKQFYSTLKTVLINHLIILPGSSYFGVAVLNTQMNLKFEDLPSGLDLFCSVMFFLIVEDFSFYWGHRLFHTPWMYKKFHKKHHEYKISIGLASSYAHPVEFLFGNLLPVGLGPMILGPKCHIFAWFIWAIIRTFETVDGHSGYDFPWSPFRMIPFSAGAAYHGYHHSHNVGNFGSFLTFWDSLCGTNKSYLGFSAKKLRSD
ncbi:hypothetical protein SteCoe_16342 [Stentor coeruleus]|uniref:Fatty acid hydroxylase domain-containing protein n=1 Tax=Stentor coeruleus TaxID=5963 RepID=A0A1R2C1G3_9CILI|nr:hypothetical protein SteCoe_16342 [Stentor coeruleus]